MNVLAELRVRFESALRPLCADPAPYVGMIRPAQDRRFGDFQANCAMSLAKERGAKPRDVAAEIVANLDVADLCETPEIAGPGFINLRLRDDWIRTAVNRTATDERLGVAPVATPRRYVVDFSSPNVAKPMHVGHLRSTVIGDALCRILRYLEHTVISDNHIGDWGTQFGMIIYGYKHLRHHLPLKECGFPELERLAESPVEELAQLYRMVSRIAEYQDDARRLGGPPIANLDEKTQLKVKVLAVGNSVPLKSLSDEHPSIAKRAREETAKLHAGDEENLRLWNQFLPECLAALQGMYDRLDIHFDTQLGESYFQPMLANVVRDLQQRGIAQESEGALCVFFEGHDAPFIVRKSDGASTYATTDLATVKYRADELQADALLYVVDKRQADHFDMLFQTARRWGYDGIDYRHVQFGTVMGEDKRPYKTRSGDTVGLESLIDEAIARARRIVDQNDDSKTNGPELDEEQRQRVAEVVGIGGIKYADLHHSRESDYVFSWDKMLATTGDTATYIQYSVARIAGIFRKAEMEREAVRQSGAEIELTHPSERELALQLIRFAEALDEVAVDNRPHLLTQYLFETANLFSTFYNECKVKDEPDAAIRASRFLLCDLTARVLTQGLQLLGIQTSEQM